MAGILAVYSLYAQRGGIRLLAGVLFFALLALLFFRLFRGAGWTLFGLLGIGLGVLFLFSPAAHLFAFGPLLILLALTGRRRARPAYQPAVTIVESGGIKRGLTPAEAAVLMEKTVGTVIGLVLVGLLRKGALVLTGHEPIAVKVAAAFQATTRGPGAREAHRRQFAQQQRVVLHPYEEPFLAQIESQSGEPVRALSLVAPFRALLHHTARRVRGYNLPETGAYYRKHLGRARHDVAHAADGPEVHKVRAHHFEWLLLDASLAALYRDERPAWLSSHGENDPALEDFVAGLMEEAAAAIPPGALRVREHGGGWLELGGRDRIAGEFLRAVSQSLFF